MTDTLIAFCGIDGAGKTTLVQEISNIIAARHTEYDVVTSKHGSYETRNILSRRISYDDPKDYLDGPSATLYAIASAIDFSRFDVSVDTPANGGVQRRRMILMDRYVDCFRAYAAAVNPSCHSLVDFLLAPYPSPDLTVFVRVSAATAWERILKRPGGPTGDESYELLCRFDQGYLSVFEGRLDVLYLDNEKSVSDSATQVLMELESRGLL